MSKSTYGAMTKDARDANQSILPEVPQAYVESLEDSHVIDVGEAHVLGPAEDGTLEAQIESTYPMFTPEDWKSPPRLLFKALAYLIIGPIVIVFWTLPRLFCKKLTQFTAWACDIFLNAMALFFRCFCNALDFIWKKIMEVFELLYKVRMCEERSEWTPPPSGSLHSPRC